MHYNGRVESLNYAFNLTTHRSRVLSQQTLTVVTQFQQDYPYLFVRPDFFPRKHTDRSVSPPLHSDSASSVDALTYSIRRSTDRRFCCYMGLLFACKIVNYPDPFFVENNNNNTEKLVLKRKDIQAWICEKWGGKTQTFAPAIFLFSFEFETWCYISVANQNRTGILLYMDHSWTKEQWNVFYSQHLWDLQSNPPTLLLTCPDAD